MLQALLAILILCPQEPIDQTIHGWYRIMKEAETRSGGKVRIGPGTLYAAIHRLDIDGLIEECAARAGDESAEREFEERMNGIVPRYVLGSELWPPEA